MMLLFFQSMCVTIQFCGYEVKKQYKKNRPKYSIEQLWDDIDFFFIFVMK